MKNWACPNLLCCCVGWSFCFAASAVLCFCWSTKANFSPPKSQAGSSVACSKTKRFALGESRIYNLWIKYIEFLAYIGWNLYHSMWDLVQKSLASCSFSWVSLYSRDSVFLPLSLMVTQYSSSPSYWFSLSSPQVISEPTPLGFCFGFSFEQRQRGFNMVCKDFFFWRSRLQWVLPRAWHFDLAPSILDLSNRYMFYKLGRWSYKQSLYTLNGNEVWLCKFIGAIENLTVSIPTPRARILSTNLLPWSLRSLASSWLWWSGGSRTSPARSWPGLIYISMLAMCESKGFATYVLSKYWIPILVTLRHYGHINKLYWTL